MKRFYVEGPFGQLHCREWGTDNSLPALICLSPSPFSSKAYLSLAPLLAEKRRVIAVDYPGFGESDALSRQASIEDYASAILAVMDHCSKLKVVDLFGFHTGCLVAVELAVSSPLRVNRMVLTDVPYFSPDKLAQLLNDTPEFVTLGADIDMLTKAWNFCVASKLELIPLPRAYQMFIDHISSAELGNTAFRAAFAYPCEERFNQVQTETFIIATKSMLHQASCNAAELIEGASLIELLDVKAAVLEKGAPVMANTVFNVLG